MDALPDLVERWERLIGRFIFAFGEVELLTFILWRHYAIAEAPPHNFKERTGRVLTKLRADTSDKRLLVPLFEKSLRLADKRNAVAHHPMAAQVFQHTRTGEHMVKFAIHSQTSDEFISDEELAQLGDTTRELVSQLYTIMWPSSGGTGAA